MIISFFGGILFTNNILSRKIRSFEQEKNKIRSFEQEKIISKLNTIPIFAIKDNKNILKPNIFISQTDAKKYVSKINSNSDPSNKVSVFPMKLGSFYDFYKNRKKYDSQYFTYIPSEKSIAAAKVILESKGLKYKSGIPLFVIKNIHDGKFAAIAKDYDAVMPFCFEKEQIDQILAETKEKIPDIVDDIDVEVVFLDDVVKNLEIVNSDFFRMFTLIPSTESQIFINETPRLLEI